MKQDQLTGCNANGNTSRQVAYEIIGMLRSDLVFCESFFFCRPTKNEAYNRYAPRNISTVRDNIVNDLFNCYGITVKPEYVSNCIYQAVWALGTFKPLNTYRHEGKGLEGWLYRIGWNAVCHRLADENFIPKVINRTAGNTRLAMLSQSVEVCETVIDDLMSDSPYYHLLTALYVDRLDEQSIMRQLGLDQVAFDQLRKSAENEFKTVLISSDHVFKNKVLKDKSSAATAVMISSDFLIDLGAKHQLTTLVNILSDVIGVNLDHDEVRLKVVIFLDDFVSKLKLSQVDQHIWHERFIEGTPPTVLAQELGRSRDWVDNRYSKANRKFEQAIRQWWIKNAA